MTPPLQKNELMNTLLRGGRSATPAEEAGDDELTQIARKLGAVDVDAVRKLAGEDAAGLSGAALRSRVVATLRGRSSWLAPTFEARFAAMPDGLHGGAGRGGTIELEPPNMTDLIRGHVASREQDRARRVVEARDDRLSRGSG